MLIEKKVLVTIFLKEEVTKDAIEQEIVDLLQHNGGIFSEDSIGAHSINVCLQELNQ